MPSPSPFDHPNLILSEHKAYDALFTKIRDVKTTTPDFVLYSKRLMRLLAEDTIAALPHRSTIIETPCCPNFEGSSLDVDKICIVSIVRAGDSLMEAVRECLPQAHIGKILIQRDESSELKEPKFYYKKMPQNVESMNIILCDPMLATGGSAEAAIRTLKDECGVALNKITFSNVISCPEGLKRMSEVYPEVKIITACIDEKLNDDKYIVPGLGDYGDRFFGT